MDGFTSRHSRLASRLSLKSSKPCCCMISAQILNAPLEPVNGGKYTATADLIGVGVNYLY